MTEAGVSYRDRSLRRGEDRSRERRGEREPERQLLLRYHRDGDLAARERLLERLLPVAYSLARRYANRGEPLEDLKQVAGLGLLKALDRYDPYRGNSLIGFATPTILGELRRHFRDKGWAVRVPRGTQELALAADRANQRLLQTLGRSPRLAELAEELNVTTEQLLEALEAKRGYETSSLARPLSAEGDAVTLADTLGEEDDGYERVEHRLALRQGWRALPPREREILHLRFNEDLTQQEIGQRIGYSQMHVSRLLRGALQRLTALVETA